MNQINAMDSGRQNIAGVTQANMAAALRQKTQIDSGSEVSKAVAVINSALKALSNEERQFFVEEEFDKIVVQLVNNDTRKLDSKAARQISTEEAILLSKKLQDIMALMAI